MITNKLKLLAGSACAIVVGAASAFQAFAVSQFADATNAATLVATDMTTDLLTLSGKILIMAGGLFILFLLWRRARKVANTETRVK